MQIDNPKRRFWKKTAKMDFFPIERDWRLAASGGIGADAPIPKRAMIFYEYLKSKNWRRVRKTLNPRDE